MLDVLVSAKTRFNEHPEGVDTSALQANEATPAARLLVALLKNMPQDALAKAAPGTLAIFSNTPVGMEASLPGSEAAMEAYAQGQTRFAAWSEKADIDGKIPEDGRWLFPKRTYQSGKRTFQLWIDRREGEPAFALSIFDPSGRLEANALLTAKGFNRSTTPSRQEKTSLGKVLLPQDIQGALNGGPNPQPIDPLTREPLDFYVRDLLLIWAKAKGFGRIIGCVSDVLMSEARGCINGPVVDLDALTETINRAGCETLVAEKTLIIRPKLPLQEEALRVDRQPLSTLYRAASRGTLSISDLCAYHASYANVYDQRPALKLMEQPIVSGLVLASREWYLPHPFLALIGLLSPSYRKELSDKGSVRLVETNLLGCLFSIAQSSSPSSPNSDDLSHTPSRLIANPAGCWADGFFGSPYTLVRRVSKGYAERLYGDLVTGRNWIEKGNSLIIDHSFIRIEQATSELGGTAVDPHDLLRTLDSQYVFFWRRERSLQLTVRFGAVAKAGPISIREPLGESSKAVPLDQVPGLGI